MKHVFVNGIQVLKDGEHTGARPGRALKGPGKVQGKDAQLEAAGRFLQEEIRKKPVPVPPASKYPIKRIS
jgi:hypothetical protein